MDTNEQVIAEHQGSATSKVVARITEWKGKQRLDIREMWRKDSDDEWKFGKGTFVPMEVAPAFVAALAKGMPAPVSASPARKLKTVTRK